jgi:hypothetical protein
MLPVIAAFCRLRSVKRFILIAEAIGFTRRTPRPLGQISSLTNGIAGSKKSKKFMKGK